VAYVLVVAGLLLGLLAVVGQLAGFGGELPEELARGARVLAGLWERGLALAPEWARPALAGFLGALLAVPAAFLKHALLHLFAQRS